MPNVTLKVFFAGIVSKLVGLKNLHEGILLWAGACNLQTITKSGWLGKKMDQIDQLQESRTPLDGNGFLTIPIGIPLHAACFLVCFPFISTALFTFPAGDTQKLI